MSYYYKYNFVSPDPVYARVKEELKSYFETGAIDDLLFPLWTEDCLRRLGRATYKLLPTLLFLDNFQAVLPPDFVAVREAWLCTNVLPQAIRLPGTYYNQITTKLGDPTATSSCTPCDNCPTDVQITYKTNTEQQVYMTRTSYLLKPGNISTLKNCEFECLNKHSSANDSFDISGNKFSTNFREGDVFMTYYALERDDIGYQLIPDNFRIQEYIRAYLKFKVFETLWNQITDETFNQIQTKYQVAEKYKDECYILADIEIKKQTLDQKVRGIKRDQNRFRKFDIK